MNLSRRTLFGAATATAAALALTANRAAAATAMAPTPILGPAPGVARLGLNENPYGPAPSAIRAIADAATKGAYYANEANGQLIKLIAEKNGVTPDHVVLSTGSGEILNAAALAWGAKGAILAPNLFWDSFLRYGEVQGVKNKRVPLKPDFTHDFPAMEVALTPDISMVVIDNPNNPTGILEAPGAVRSWAANSSKKAFVLVDEAYIELTADESANTVLPLIKQGMNVGICRTFSKIYGMAGIRVGYLITTPENAAKIRPYIMSSLPGTSLAAAIASYNDDAFLAFSKSKVLEGRQMVESTLKTVGLKYLPSNTNFIFVDVGMDANIVRQRMMERGIMIRGVYGSFTTMSRVSMGRIEDMERYCKALPEVIKA